MVWTDEDNLANAIAFTLLGLVGAVLVSTVHSFDSDVALEYHLHDPAQLVGSALLQSLHDQIGGDLRSSPLQVDHWYDPLELQRYFAKGMVLETLNESWGLSVSDEDRLHVFLHLRARLVDLAGKNEIWAETCVYERTDRDRDPVETIHLPWSSSVLQGRCIFETIPAGPIHYGQASYKAVDL
jgi:hypothetical protein